MFASVIVAFARARPIIRIVRPIRSFCGAKTYSALALTADLRPLARSVRLGIGRPRGFLRWTWLFVPKDQPSLVLRGAGRRCPLPGRRRVQPCCREGPDVAGGVCRLDQTFAQPGAVVPGCIRDDLTADDPVHPVDADMGLTAEGRDRDVDGLRAIGTDLRLQY